MENIRILFVEDLSTDVEMARRVLKKETIPFSDLVVDTELAFRKALDDFKPDLIISDYSMPTFDGMQALTITRGRSDHIPFIVLTGSMNEETAVACMKAGADDYVIKEKIKRLPFAVREVLEKVKVRRENERLEKERTRLMFAVEQAGEMFLMTDTRGSILYVNPAFEEVTGYRREEVLGKNPRILKSGIQGPDYYREMWETLAQGRIWKGRMVNRRKDGTHFTEDAVISPVRDAGGRIVHYSAVKRDITDHLKSSEMLQQAQKMESVGRLAGGVAHDYNNMLSVILGYTELAMDRVAPDDPLYEDLQEILNAARRSADITRQLLAFARKQAVAPVTLDINDTVEGMLKMLRRLIGEDIDLVWLPSAGVWPVRMDPSQLDQILANLCVNARDAIDGVGKLTIETHNKTFDREFCEAHAAYMDGCFVLLSVSDDGRGMDRETLNHVFEPFFTTKNVGEGTGLGLATVYGVVKQNNGFIHVASEVGKGTAFHIYLPRNTSGGTAVRTEEPGDIPRGSGETVLLVEDEPSIRKVAQLILEKLGYRVSVAETPGEALRLVASGSKSFELLITDVVMPEMNGRTLADQFHKVCLGSKTLFMSGYTSNTIAQHGVLDEGMNFIQKPFTKKDLAVAVSRALKNLNASGGPAGQCV